MAGPNFFGLHSNDGAYCFKNNEAYCLKAIAGPVISTSYATVFQLVVVPGVPKVSEFDKQHTGKTKLVPLYVKNVVIIWSFSGILYTPHLYVVMEYRNSMKTPQLEIPQCGINRNTPV